VRNTLDKLGELLFLVDVIVIE